MDEWAQVKLWRRDRRDELIQRRAHLPRAQRQRIHEQVTDTLRDYLANQPQSCIGFYWPFKGEIDLRALIAELLHSGAAAALPVVVEKARPLEFWRWTAGMRTKPGIWRIPVPEVRDPVQPGLLLIPLVGFDTAGYRLGYGGGYYDRSLAMMHPTPHKIGVGQELGRLPSIHPQPHDIPLDLIITESGITEFRR